MVIKLKRGILIAMLVLIGIATITCVGGSILPGPFSPTRGFFWGSALLEGYLFSLTFAAFFAIERGPRWLRIWGSIGLWFIALSVLAVPVYVVWRASLFGPVYDYQWHKIIDMLFEGLIYTTGWMALMPMILTPRMKWGRIIQNVTAIAISFAVFCGLRMAIVPRGEPEVVDPFHASLIVSGAGVLAIVVMQRFGEIKVADPLTSDTRRIWLRCPRCGKEQDVASGESQCSACKLKFTIEVEEPRCPQCGYNLHALTRPVCPECGRVLRVEDIPVAPAGGSGGGE